MQSDDEMGSSQIEDIANENTQFVPYRPKQKGSQLTEQEEFNQCDSLKQLSRFKPYYKYHMKYVYTPPKDPFEGKVKENGTFNKQTICALQSKIMEAWHYIGDEVSCHIDKNDASASYLNSLKKGKNPK